MSKHNTNSPSRHSPVPLAIAEDMALSGDTRHELHTKALPRRRGPNFDTAEPTTARTPHASDNPFKPNLSPTLGEYDVEENS